MELKKENANRAFIDSNKIANYAEYFNSVDDEFISQYISNENACCFLQENIPLLDCPDKELETTYYFRWWTLRKHIRETEDGFVFTEFLPNVGWSGKHNTIICASGFHIAESRWLANRKFSEDYIRFWYKNSDSFHDYISWLPYAAYQQAEVSGNTELIKELLPDFADKYAVWEKGVMAYGGNPVEQHDNGLFYSYDFFDGSEMSIGGNGYRPLFNSALYGSADAIARIAKIAGNAELEKIFTSKAAALKTAVQKLLWNDEKKFFVVRKGDNQFQNVRELQGFSPWYFGLPEEGMAQGFDLLKNADGFDAPYGPTYAEQSHPNFELSYIGHECKWNGPSWPFATSLTLGSMENLLNQYHDHSVTKRHYFDLLQIYAKSHRFIRENGEIVPWIDENLNPYTGDWISRTCLKTWHNGTWSREKGGYERGKDYNHSMFCNHIIGGLIGLRPSIGNTLVINPLVSETQWQWFCLANVKYHDSMLTILWDIDGEHYKSGRGFLIWYGGKLLAKTSRLEKISIDLTEDDKSYD